MPDASVVQVGVALLGFVDVAMFPSLSTPTHRLCDPHATSFMVVAANQTNTTIHAFEYVKLQRAVDFSAHVDELASITGTLSRIEPNPNKSHAIVLRIYIDDATVAFSKKS